MKITMERASQETGQHHPRTTTATLKSPQPLPPDLSHKPTFPRKPTRRKTKTGVKKESSKARSSSSRPETPLLEWKLFDQVNRKDDSVHEDEEEKRAGRRSGRKVRPVVSARKLGAGLWRLDLPEFQNSADKKNKLGHQVQSGDDRFPVPIHDHHVGRMLASPARDFVHSPHFVSGPSHGLLHKLEPAFQFSNSAMEGATKWDPISPKASDQLNQIFGQRKQQENAAGKISALEAELEQARSRISELEMERRSSKKKIEQFLQKLSEEKAAWRRREHEKVRATIDDMKADMTREKKSRQRLEVINSKLVHELADARSSAKLYLQEYEKERKDREMIEEVCDELAKEMEVDKAEAEALKIESNKLWEEVEEERKMLQMAEVWREERVQMKLVDAKVMLEEKYSQMNQIVADLETFLKSRISSSSGLEEKEKAELILLQVAESVNMQDVREMTCEPPNPDDICSAFEEIIAESNEKEVAESCNGYSPEVKMPNKDIHMDRSGELEEDSSEWETVSHQASNYSPDHPNDGNFRASNVSRSGTEESPVVEISEVVSVQPRQVKKVSSSISKLWRSYSSNGSNYKAISVDKTKGRLSNGQVTNGMMTMSLDCGLEKGFLGPQDFVGQWSSPDSGMNRGMRGCMEWPRNSTHKSSLKSRLSEARSDNQKIQLRQVLKQKI